MLQNITPEDNFSKIDKFLKSKTSASLFEQLFTIYSERINISWKYIFSQVKLGCWGFFVQQYCVKI